MANQREFLDRVGASIGVSGSDLSPWYSLSQARLRKLGLRSLLESQYDGSVYKMLQSAYPEHTWHPWKFQRLPLTLTIDEKLIEEVLQYLEVEKKLSAPEDWYRLSEESLKELGVSPLISKAGGLSNVLQRYRPSFNWQGHRFARSQKTREL